MVDFVGRFQWALPLAATHFEFLSLSILRNFFTFFSTISKPHKIYIFLLSSTRRIDWYNFEGIWWWSTFFEKISKYRNSKSLAARGRARSERPIKATITKYPKSYTKRLVSASLTRLDKVKVNLREKLFLLSLRGEVRTRVSKSQKWSRINFFSKYGNFNIFEFDPPFDRSRRDKHFRLLFSSGNMTGSGSKSRLKIGLKIENRTSGCPILTFRPCIDITRWGD